MGPGPPLVRVLRRAGSGLTLAEQVADLGQEHGLVAHRGRVGLGLAAAIPAVVIYNYLARSIAGCKALFANTSTEVLNLTSREIAQPPERRRTPVVPARLPAE